MENATEETSELHSLLMTQSLTDEELLRATGLAPDYRILPDVSVLKIGGQSVIDRGRGAVYPVVEQLAAAAKRHKIMIGTGAGTRARHLYAVAGQNAEMLGHLLARFGITVVGISAFSGLPLYLAERNAVIFPGMPPYDMWQHVPDEGTVPPYRTDAGCYLVSEVYGCKAMIFVKDEDGLYTANPKGNDKATFIPSITVDELIEMNLPDLVIERPVLDLLRHARHVTSVQVINGLKPGLIERALDGEHVGTIISAN